MLILGEFAAWGKREAGRYITWSRIAQALLLIAFALNIYRAVTQSITTDEAFTYENFVSRPWAGLLEPFDANNHVLNSVLSRLSIAVFGLSEWSLRIPSVIGGGIYLFAAYRLCFLLFDGGAWSFITLALLVTDPFLLDYLSVARGYGLALAFAILAAYELVRAGERMCSGSLYLAGLYFGLSLAANLTALFPLAALALALIALSAARGTLQWKVLWSELAVPATLVSFVFLVLPLSRAQPQSFYFGSRRMVDCVRSLANLSFSYGPVRLPWISRFGYIPRLLRAAVVPLSALLILACAVVAGLGLWKMYRVGSETNREDLGRCFFALSLVSATGLVMLAHATAGLPYPLSRTALYFIPLAFLATSSIFYRYRKSGPLHLSAGLVASVCLVAFLLQADVSYYAEWRFDAGTKRIVNFIRSRNALRKHLTVRTSWASEPTLNFYRLLYRLNWDPVDRSGPDRAGDVVILNVEDQQPARTSRLRVIYKDPVSLAIVAVPNANARPGATQ
jgi:hypothetical protein